MRYCIIPEFMGMVSLSYGRFKPGVPLFGFLFVHQIPGLVKTRFHNKKTSSCI